MMCRTYTPTSTLTRSCWKKWLASCAVRLIEKPPACGRLSSCGNRAEQVFNTIVENSVEKHESIFVSDSARDGSALCTGVSAGTFVLQPSASCARCQRHHIPSQA